jgi:hypothetical protein
MKANGGYAIIDCKGLDLANPATVAGLHDSIKAGVENGKVLVLENTKNGTTNFSPITAYGGFEDGGVFVSFFPITMHVSTSDVVTI